MSRCLLVSAEWPRLLARVRALAPEAFDSGGRVLNLLAREWGHPGTGRPCVSPVDGSQLGALPMLDAQTAQLAVRAAAAEAREWARVPLEVRRERVRACLQHMRAQRELLALLLAWEIGKPVPQARVSVERCLSGVEWYLEGIEEMLHGREPLGLVSNIASWNYPLSVLMHAVLVQVLCGNAVIAKTPTDGGLHTLTLCMAFARRCGLPVSLVSGAGSQLGEALVRHPLVACVSFVGGKDSGRAIAEHLEGRDTRSMLEMEGVNSYGVWHFSDWESLAGQLRKGFEYGKQRCTAYVRWVVERSLLPRFLETYLPVVASLKVGHPLAGETPDAAAPALDFGPLIHEKKAEELRAEVADAVARGALPLYAGRLDPALFLDGQDTSAYVAPHALLQVPRSHRLHHGEPFGPVDTLVVVDREEELVAEMNVSNGALVASIACDETETARRIATGLRAFKVGINVMRSRGDREEAFGGVGGSWHGCFVGGVHLVHAVTRGAPGERLYGNLPDTALLPPVR
ncbi:MAG: aldehyde dehydrogenase family protein [Myxococcaceae bacterium]|nr:aldehyde dehydrogenase family protein [Myxococcaceae bacterium]MCI0671597.1 aldehyde dehydrogenase family protein [Myxococcaceae bacterium]